MGYDVLDKLELKSDEFVATGGTPPVFGTSVAS